jgi:hypothetical protein
LLGLLLVTTRGRRNEVRCCGGGDERLVKDMASVIGPSLIAVACSDVVLQIPVERSRLRMNVQSLAILRNGLRGQLNGVLAASNPTSRQAMLR